MTTPRTYRILIEQVHETIPVNFIENAESAGTLTFAHLLCTTGSYVIKKNNVSIEGLIDIAINMDNVPKLIAIPFIAGDTLTILCSGITDRALVEIGANLEA